MPPQFESKIESKFPKWVKYIFIVIILFVLLVIVLNLYTYFFTIHDYESCIKAGGEAKQNNELFYCKLNSKLFWNTPDKGLIN